MRPIPPALRRRIADDPAMRKCCMPECMSQVVEWDHAFTYAGRQVNEAWAIVPLCWYHHRGGGLDRPWTQWFGLRRATEEDLAKYPRTDWEALKSRLRTKYGGTDD